jgi:Domain of unknown function (DUF1127)
LLLRNATAPPSISESIWSAARWLHDFLDLLAVGEADYHRLRKFQCLIYAILHSCAAALIFLYVIQVLISHSYRGMRKLPHRRPQGVAPCYLPLWKSTEIGGVNADLSGLSSLSDRELADIGISRADVYRVAWE